MDKKMVNSRLATMVPILFFFSSRRRHTRWPRDWSSDVCSSDLEPREDAQATARAAGQEIVSAGGRGARAAACVAEKYSGHHERSAGATEIGRASCRETVETSPIAAWEQRGCMRSHGTRASTVYA